MLPGQPRRPTHTPQLRKHMRIAISYMLLGEGTARITAFGESDYFDLDPSGVPSVNSLPKYAHAHQYLAHLPSELKWTSLHITDEKDFWCVRTQYLSGDKCIMIHTFGSDGHEEIINQTEIEPGLVHTVRTLKTGSRWSTVMSIADSSAPNAAFSRDYITTWTFEECQSGWGAKEGE